jgi:hypothetical protein
MNSQINSNDSCLPAIVVTYYVCAPHLILHMARHPVIHMAPHMVFQMALHTTLHMVLHMVLLCKMEFVHIVMDVLSIALSLNTSDSHGEQEQRQDKSVPLLLALSSCLHIITICSSVSRHVTQVCNEQSVKKTS